MSIIELRQYALHPGKRDTLVELFEREFVEPQEAAGMTLLGTFRDARDPDRFVWIRQFAGMASRAAGLRAFYGGPVWKAHRDAANATMIDSDDVLLLRPANARCALPVVERRPQTERSSIYVANAYLLTQRAEEGFAAVFEDRLRPALEAAGVEVLGCYVTERSPNDFPALPVREGVNAFVWFERFDDDAAYRASSAALERSSVWREAAESVAGGLSAPIETRVLVPTARSRLR